MPWRPPEARTASCAILHLVYGVDLLLFVCCVTWVGGWWATWGRQGLYGLHIATVIWCNLFVCDVFVWLQLCDWHHQWSTLQDGPPGPNLAVKCTSCLASWAWLWKMHQMANCQKCQEPHIPAIWDPLAPVGQQGLVPNRPLPAELWEYKTGSHYVLALGASHHESHVMQCMFVCCHAVRFMPCCFMNVMQHQVLHAMCIKNESIAMIII